MPKHRDANAGVRHLRKAVFQPIDKPHALMQNRNDSRFSGFGFKEENKVVFTSRHLNLRAKVLEKAR